MGHPDPQCNGQSNAGVLLLFMLQVAHQRRGGSGAGGAVRRAHPAHAGGLQPGGGRRQHWVPRDAAKVLQLAGIPMQSAYPEAAGAEVAPSLQGLMKRGMRAVYAGCPCVQHIAIVQPRNCNLLNLRPLWGCTDAGSLVKSDLPCGRPRVAFNNGGTAALAEPLCFTDALPQFLMELAVLVQAVLWPPPSLQPRGR